MDLRGSSDLKELPDLSSATNLEILDLSGCESLVEIPTSFSHLQKLKKLWVTGCINLQVIPDHMNLESLERVNMAGCSRLRNIPLMSTNIKYLYISGTEVEDVPTSCMFWSCLTSLTIRKSGNLKGLIDFPTSVTDLDLSFSDIETVSDSIKDLHGLSRLDLTGCRRLISLPELPSSIQSLIADDCESLETVFLPLNTPNASLNFTNCFKLSQQVRRAIIQQSFSLGTLLLPGSEVPEEFNHRGIGNSLIINRSDGNNPGNVLVVCVVISSTQQEYSSSELCIVIAGDLVALFNVGEVYKFRSKHLFIFKFPILDYYTYDMSKNINFEFCNLFEEFDVIECGAKFLISEGIYETGLEQVLEDNDEFEPSKSFEDHADKVVNVWTFGCSVCLWIWYEVFGFS